MEIEPEDRRQGPVAIKLKTLDGKTMNLRLAQAPLRISYTYGKVVRTFEVMGVDDKGRLVYEPVGEARKAK
jgi:hypothetical protein